jgi:hypothetical protein
MRALRCESLNMASCLCLNVNFGLMSCSPYWQGSGCWEQGQMCISHVLLTNTFGLCNWGPFLYVVCGLLLHLPHLCKKWLVMHIVIPYF